MAAKIDLAAENGVDFWIFDWYMYDDGPFLQRALEEGYLEAPNEGKVKFALMWANHDWIDIFPAKAGVPALNASSGNKYVGKPEDYGTKLREEYTAKHYHQPSDELQPDWVTTGTVEEADFYLKVAYKVAQGDKYPEWKPGNEFKATRDAMLGKPQ